MISADTFADHLCPECGHKIGFHTNSPFGHNPSNKKGEECNRSYNSLLIEKLTSWWNDAMSERDAYAKSYDGVCKDNILIHKKLEIAVNALKKIQTLPFNLTDEGVRIFHVADDAINEIEETKE